MCLIFITIILKIKILQYINNQIFKNLEKKKNTVKLKKNIKIYN